MKTQTIIVGIGEILWDVFPGGKRLGGAPANFSYHCKVLGASSHPVSCIGNDPLGTEIKSTLGRLGINQQYIFIDNQHPTSTVTVKIDPAGKPDYTIHENVAWDHIPLTNELVALAQKTDAVCFGTLAQRSHATRNTIRQFIQATRPSCLKVCDINLRQHYYCQDTVQHSLEYANILKLNDEELPIVAKLTQVQGDESKMLYGLLEKFSLDLIVLTKGSHGSRLVGGSEDIVCKAIKAKQIADTVGAGDSFTAAMIMGLLHHLPLFATLEFASRLACHVCSQTGATPKIPQSLLDELHSYL